LVRETEFALGVKQAFWNLLLLLVCAVEQLEPSMELNPLESFAREFKQTTSYIELQQRITEKHSSVEKFAECLSQLNDKGFDHFQALLSAQTNQINEQVTALEGIEFQVKERTFQGLMMFEDLLTCYINQRAEAFYALGPTQAAPEGLFRFDSDFVIADFQRHLEVK
jgi:hypothetical protein